MNDTAHNDATTPIAEEDAVIDLQQHILNKDADATQQDAPSAPQMSETEALTMVVADLKDQLLRAVAETENVRKRGQRELEESRKYAVTGFARDLTTVIENLYRAIHSIPAQARAENETLNNLGLGLDMTLNDLTATLERYGIKRLWPEGEAFDHNHHQAISQIDNNEHPAGTVLQVLQAGYKIHDRLLQPAMVCVARPTQASTPTQHVDTQA
jgi:molecular chaperone GrpE